jgi:phosphate transport system substrate-binding protein
MTAINIPGMRRELAVVVIGASLGLLAAQARAQDRIVIKGSNTFGEELAPALVERYRKEHPQVTFELESKGSGSGFEALLNGGCDIAASSRSPTEDEKRLAASRAIKLNDYLIGFYGVAVIINDQNPVKALTDTQVRDVFTGAVTNWKELSGDDAAIQLYIRDPVSGTHLGFRELAMRNQPYAPTAKPLTRYADIIEAVRGDRAGIGYASMNLGRQKGVRAVMVNKVQPTATAVNEGNYPYSRTLRLYTAKNRESAAVKGFIRFIRSRAGQSILAEHGFVRVFEERLWSPEM